MNSEMVKNPILQLGVELTIVAQIQQVSKGSRTKGKIDNSQTLTAINIITCGKFTRSSKILKKLV